MKLRVVVLAADLAGGRIAITDVGVGAALGGVLGEASVRLAAVLGYRTEADGWREGAFLGALAIVAMWAFAGLDA